MEPGYPALEFAGKPILAQCRRLWVIVLTIGLAACSTPPKATFDLNPAGGDNAVRAGRSQLAIWEPNAILPADSDRIVVRTSSEAVAYLTGARWADRLPALVQARLIESFQNARLLRAVGRPGMLADYSLHTIIRRFELDVAQSEAVVEISAQLIEPSGRSRAAKDFSARIAVPSDAPADVAAALDAALGGVMHDMVSWTATKI